MLTTTLYNMKGEKVGEIELPEKIFGVPVNPDMVHFAAVVQSANGRQVLAHTKDRGEVSGGGKKPWKQKGSGRSRHGSTRSPIWRHGGVTFGPTKERNFGKKINKKMKQNAVSMMLSSKAADKELIVLDQFAFPEPKTRLMADLLKKLPINGKSTLVALPARDKNILLAAKNLPSVKTVMINDVNVGDLLGYKYLLMPKEAIEALEKRIK
ncbi:50S ribosomal protein L4 [Candidatus Azambacteria bacterium RIFCSPLOWO2_02_FULL_46_11]|uniref:Large ribosomal subunit protein uL4 n=4 Tax=Candidatus Azamiibacteriota TaxID=1752741 RepID=A0A1F5C6K4_9BACT|nr:MAG: 50S ribosomal protein L4 [Candidatus Azambacteria bacterium RIFCSPLOWO2_01_FULL_46_26]OGD44778.1 MAG: 50S ribosomal protein L4 [Candidatus Azambacteria bacterium RIFCSPLOWO2_02_FULL_46_11]